VLCANSAPDVDWLMDKFDLDLSLLAGLGGHSQPRTHRGKERFPGMTITYALMEKLEQIQDAEPARAKIITKATANRLLTDSDGTVTGVEFTKGGETFTERGIVIIATGGYGADFADDSLLQKYRPDLAHLPTTNGDHCSGDGIKMALSVGGSLKDMERVQVHPTGLINPEEPDAKVKFLAAEALRGCGALLLDANGERFCNELGRRDYVSGCMFKSKGPFRLVLNGAASKEIEWHCKHYVGRGLMKHFTHGDGLAEDMGISTDVLRRTFDSYNKIAEAEDDPFGKKFFKNGPFKVDDYFNVAIVTPVIHYTMGGVHVSADSEVLSEDGRPVPGLWATGEVMGGTHGINRLGGSSLLDCVVFGRVSGRNAAGFLMKRALDTQQASAEGRLANVLGHLAGVTTTISQGGVDTTIQISPEQNNVSINFNWSGNGAPQVSNGNQGQAFQSSAPASPTETQNNPTEEAPAPAELKEYSLDDVAKHATEKDCWVVVNDEVLDVTEFLPEHPGGKKAILLFAGRDASEEFNMLHKRDVVAKYAPESIIGNLKQ